MTKSSDIDEFSNCNCTGLRKASRRLSHLYDATLASTGVKSTQYSILAEIERRGNQRPTVRELADALVMDRSTMGKNLRPIERDRLIELIPSETDRRVKHVVLTQHGRARLAQAQVLWRSAQSHFEQSFGPTAAGRLRAVLHAIATSPALALPVQSRASE